MKDTASPILFSGEMVRAILAGRKTQTRRVVKMKHSDLYRFREMKNGRAIFDAVGKAPRSLLPILPTFGVNCPYGNTTLWVRETFQFVQANSDGQRGTFKSVKPFTQHDYQWIEYAATSKFKDTLPWKPSIFMPRWASRITLAVENVRVERLKAITEKDAKAEGVQLLNGEEFVLEQPYTEVYHNLWDRLNGKRGLGWIANPFVWVVTFKNVSPL